MTDDFKDGNAIRAKGAQIVEDMRKTRVEREHADWNRENYQTLHQRQRDTFLSQADRLDKFETSATLTINSLTRLRVFVTLTDLNLGVFIGEARTRARTAYLTGTRNWHHHYTHDVADINIKLTGRTVHIRIMSADAFWFEFATSGKPIVVSTVVQGGISFNTYKACMVGVFVRVKENVLVTSPTILKNKRDADGAKLSLVKRPYQVQLTDEPVVYPYARERLGRIRATHALYESFAPVHSWTGAPLRNTDGIFSTFQVNTICGPSSTYNTRDQEYDMPFGDTERADPIRLAYIQGAADWPRANSKQKVKSDDYGEREFVIYVDAFNQFAIFPASAIGPLDPTNTLNQNVPEAMVQRITPALPAWVYVPAMKAKDYIATPGNTIETWCVDQPEFDWKFNSTGTKCASIVMEREAYSYDSTFWTADASALPMSGTKFATLSSYLGVYSNFAQAKGVYTYSPTRYFTAPGIIELSINIELTGPSPEQFVASIEVKVIRQPSTSYDPLSPQLSRCSLFVGYTWYDIPKNNFTNYRVLADTLVSVDIELWRFTDGTVGELTQRQALMSVYDIVGNKEIFTTVAAPVLGIDLTTLSLALRLDAYTENRKTTGDGVVLNFPVHHFGVWIIHSGVTKEVLFPETISDVAKKMLTDYSQTNGRNFLAARMAINPGLWEYLPLTTPRDAWVDSNINDFREWWAHEAFYWYDMYFSAIDPDSAGPGYVRYKTAGTQPARTTAMDEAQKWLGGVGGDYVNLFFCDSPRWGWQQYQGVMAKYMFKHAFNTFYTHPNGSYMFWDNGFVYDRNGIPGDFTNVVGPGGTSNEVQGSGTDSEHDTLAIYDASLIEHVIFDRVHFEIKVKGSKTHKKDTTFMELYNRAVDKGVKNGTLDPLENINPMTLADQRATFSKEIGNDTTFERLFLDLKVTWNTHDYWYGEQGWSRPYTGGTIYPPVAGSSGNFNTLHLYGFWRLGNYASGALANAPGFPNAAQPDGWHIRFANPLIIMEK